MKIELAKTEIIHFVGIGGIGMSGLALIMKGLGFKVQGSDISSNKNIERLKKNKIKVYIGHNKKNIQKSTILVISSAIKQSNSEIIEAKEKQLPIYKRGDMLAHIVSLTKNIVVAGSHGKTTTTSLVASIFSKTKLDPTIINGGVLNSFNNSAKLGKSDWCILESDESDGSFNKIPSTYSIVTNIDKEHLDHYKSLEVLKKNFINFIQLISPTTSKYRMKRIIKDSHDMIYYISMLSTTVGRLKVSPKEIFKNYNKIKIIGCKTIRERNGIACTSRNFLLSVYEKKIASKIYKILVNKKKHLINGSYCITRIIELSITN